MYSARVRRRVYINKEWGNGLQADEDAEALHGEENEIDDDGLAEGEGAGVETADILFETTEEAQGFEVLRLFCALCGGEAGSWQSSTKLGQPLNDIAQCVKG